MTIKNYQLKRLLQAGFSIPEMIRFMQVRQYKNDLRTAYLKQDWKHN